MKKFVLSIIIALSSIALFAQDCSDLFFSEYVEGSGNNRALEIYNPTNEPIDLSGYQLVRYRNGGFTPNAVGLEGILQPKDVFVVVSDKRNPNGTGFEVPIDSALEVKADLFVCPVYEVNAMMYFDGNDGVTLEKTTGEIVDIVCKIGPPITEDDSGWGSLTDTTITWNNQGVPEQYTISEYIVGPLFWLSWTENQTLIRKASVKQGVKDNPEVFVVNMEWDSLPQNTFDSLGFHHCDCNTSGIHDFSVNHSFNVFPNPLTGQQFKVLSTEPFEMIEVVSMLGESIYKEKTSLPVWQYTGDIRTLTNGVYFVRVTFKDGSMATQKLIYR